MRRLLLLISLACLVSGCAASRAPQRTAPVIPSEEVSTDARADIFYIIDGRTATRVEVERLTRDRIANIEVIKGPAAVARYGVFARAGVVRITTVDAEPPRDSRLYFIDGRSASIADVRRLATDAIERVEILKGAAAAALYGSEARAGVVLVSTKRGRQ